MPTIHVQDKPIATHCHDWKYNTLKVVRNSENAYIIGQNKLID